MNSKKIYYNLVKSIVQNRLGGWPNPNFITFLITWRCNCKCSFCNIWKKNASGKNELTIEQIEKIFSQFKELDVLRITGGEPFIRKDLADVINVMDEGTNPAVIHLTTNGLLPERIVETVKKVKSPEKLHIKISIDEVGEKHDLIRGRKEAYNRAIKSLEELIKFKRISPDLTIGINFAITSPESMEAYKYLRDKFKPAGIGLYPVIAHKNDNALYSPTATGTSSVQFETYGNFSAGQLKACMEMIMADSKEDGSFSEKMVSRYFLRGLENRLLFKKNYPSPRCVALANHLRILPDGSVPVCYFNNQIVGNLLSADWKELKKSEDVQNAREWTAKCPGCWESCEVVPSAVYTGDMIRSLIWP